MCKDSTRKIMPKLPTLENDKSIDVARRGNISYQRPVIGTFKMFECLTIGLKMLKCPTIDRQNI